MLNDLFTRLFVAIAIIVTSETLPAHANYREMLKKGTTRKAVFELYSKYASDVLPSTSPESDTLTLLAGSADYQNSLMLAFLSNGWAIRASDVDHRYSPPAGVWLFSEENYQGRLKQFPAAMPQTDAIDIASIENFQGKSLLVGPNVKAELFSESRFRGESSIITGSITPLPHLVQSLKVRTPPRIDYVSLLNYCQQDQTCSFSVHLSGANIDSGARIEIEGGVNSIAKHQSRLDNANWLGLGWDRAHAGYSMDPTYFAFPIYHYDSVYTDLDHMQVGQEISISVSNPDNQRSNSLTLTIPCKENLDSDGDGFLDDWESKGVNGLDLPAMGANPNRKDVFVEVDRMIVKNRVWSDFAERDYPLPKIFEDASHIFSQAPILNPDGSSGISLHIDFGQPEFEKVGKGSGGSLVPWTKFTGFGAKAFIKPPENYTDAEAVRNNPMYFATNRHQVFRYCLFADQQFGTGSTGGGRTGSTFFLTLGVSQMRAIEHNFQLGVFIHELGHTFGLSHVGEETQSGLNYKPNFNSLMNYLFTFKGRDIDGKLSAVDGKPTGDYVYAYSEGMNACLDEASLLEVLGVANHYPHDWNGNGMIDLQPVPKDLLKENPPPGFQKLTDTSDWGRLKFPLLNP